MKIRNYFTILFSIIAITALLGIAGYITYIDSDDANPVKQVIDDKVLPLAEPAKPYIDKALSYIPGYEPAPETEAAPAAPADEQLSQTPAAGTQSSQDHSIIFVGDSRTVSMGKAVNDGCVYIGEEGEGYHWFSSTGVSKLRTELEGSPLTPVIFNFGVNDPENVNVYIDLYKNLASEYSSTPFRYMSVNPLSEDSDFNTTNEMIELFNKTLKSAFPDDYIDTYEYLKTNGFSAVDGLHYDDATSVKIHDYAVSVMK